MSAQLFNPHDKASAQVNQAQAAQGFAETLAANLAQAAQFQDAKLEDGTYRKFVCCYPSCNYIFKDGQVAIFKGGVYVTNNPLRIAELETEIKNGHPHITMGTPGKSDYQQTADDLDPEARAKAHYFALFKKEQEAAANRDMGSNEGKPKLNVANSKDMAAVTANGAGTLGNVPMSVLNAINMQSQTAPTAQ